MFVVNDSTDASLLHRNIACFPDGNDILTGNKSRSLFGAAVTGFLLVGVAIGALFFISLLLAVGLLFTLLTVPVGTVGRLLLSFLVDINFGDELTRLLSPSTIGALFAGGAPVSIPLPPPPPNLGVGEALLKEVEV